MTSEVMSTGDKGGTSHSQEAAAGDCSGLSREGPDVGADLKRQLRRLEPRALVDLAQVVRQLRAATPLVKLAAWFRHCLSSPQLN